MKGTYSAVGKGWGTLEEDGIYTLMVPLFGPDRAFYELAVEMATEQRFRVLFSNGETLYEPPPLRP